VQASTVYGHDNRYVVDAVRAHPDRFRGVFSIDVLAPDARSQLQRWLDAGLDGLRLFTTGTTMPGQADWLDDERSFPVWDYAQQHGVSICLQMTAAGIPALVHMLELFPRSRVLLDHLARPELAGGPPYTSAAALFGLAAYPGVHLKLTNRTIARSRPRRIDAGGLLPARDRGLRRAPHRLGLELPGRRRHARHCWRKRAALDGICETDRRGSSATPPAPSTPGWPKA
jgi:predicted TIM-barrel fold metal-dependent hydrolase